MPPDTSFRQVHDTSFLEDESYLASVASRTRCPHNNCRTWIVFCTLQRPEWLSHSWSHAKKFPNTITRRRIPIIVELNSRFHRHHRHSAALRIHARGKVARWHAVKFVSANEVDAIREGKAKVSSSSSSVQKSRRRTDVVAAESINAGVIDGMACSNLVLIVSTFYVLKSSYDQERHCTESPRVVD